MGHAERDNLALPSGGRNDSDASYSPGTPSEMHVTSSPAEDLVPSGSDDAQSPTSKSSLREGDGSSPLSGPFARILRIERKVAPWRARFLQTRTGEVLCVIVALSAQLIAQAQIDHLIFPVKNIAQMLGEYRPSYWAWLPASFALTTGIFVLPMGRLGDIYGHKLLIIFGLLVNIALNIATGFVRSFIPFCILRALCGIGASALLPNSVAVLGRAFEPGFKRNLSFALFGALAPTGAFIGALMTSLIIVRLGDFEWAFWVTSVFCAIFLALAYIVLPADEPLPHEQMDWIGGGLGLTAMILFNFVWNQAPLVGWETVYVYVLLIVSVISFAAFFWWEGKQGDNALVPRHMFAKKETPLVCLALWFGWMSFGDILFYAPAWLRDIQGYENPLLLTAHFVPLAVVGMSVAMFNVWLVPRLDGHYIFAIAMLAFFTGNLMLSVAPPDLTYWAVIFPAICICTLGPDFSYTAGQLIISNSVSREYQGTAAGLVNTITNYSLSIGLGMAGTVERYVGHDGENVLAGYRGAFRFALGIAALGFVLVVLFVRTPKQRQGIDKIDDPEAQGHAEYKAKPDTVDVTEEKKGGGVKRESDQEKANA